MKPKNQILTIAAAGMLAFSCNHQEPKPNFVFILIDDLGWTDLACYGSKLYETPNLDRLAASGMLFGSAYAACQVSSPTRASLMTGKYPAGMFTTDYFGAPQPETSKNHWTRNKPLLPAPYNEELALEEVTIAEALKEAGYATFFAGKWHLGPETHWPEHQGFDYNKGGTNRGGPYGGNKYFSPYENPRLEDGPEGEHLCIRLANETAAFIEKHHKDSPFLAFLSTYSVHTPLMTTQKLKEKYEAKIAAMGLVDNWDSIGNNRWRQVQSHAVYAGMVEIMDSAVGVVMAKLKELNIEKNTVVIFTSDNGGLATSEGHPTTNLPLKAGKGWIYEGGIRVPLIVSWPGKIKPGTRCDDYLISTDYFPTILEMAGLPLQPHRHTGGKSFLPLLKNERSDRGPVFWHYPHWGNQGGSPSSAVRDGEWKLIEWHLDKSIELYNLYNDPGENLNLAKTNPEKSAALLAKLNAWRNDQQVRYPSPNPDYHE